MKIFLSIILLPLLVLVQYLTFTRVWGLHVHDWTLFWVFLVLSTVISAAAHVVGNMKD